MQYILEYRTVKGPNLEYRIFINHENLRVIRSFIGDNIQVVKCEGYHEFYLEWLEDDEKNQKEMTGNSCCLSDLGEQVTIENLFSDYDPKITISKSELIETIKRWIDFCKDSQERTIELKTVNLCPDCQ